MLCSMPTSARRGSRARRTGAPTASAAERPARPTTHRAEQAIRYDTPAIGALSLGASVRERRLLGCRCAPSPAPRAMPATIFASGSAGTDGNEAIIASAQRSPWGRSGLRSPGVTATTGQGGRNNESMFAKLDHTYGDGSVAVYYRRGEDADGDEGSTCGASVSRTAWAEVQPRTPATGWSTTMPMRTSMDGVLAGVRVTFN